MPIFSPTTLAEWTTGTWDRSPPDELRGFVFDSRQAGPGDVFVCLKTERRDGHAFLGMAREKGAAAALVSRPDATVPLPQLVVKDPLAALQEAARRHRQGFSGAVIGVTGSCGKTSTKELLAHLLEESGGVYASRGNFNNYIGVPVTLLGLEPEAHQVAVAEAGINLPGEMMKLAEIIAPTNAIITLVAAVHLENLGSLEGVAREKALLGAAVPADGSVAFPADCLRYPEFRRFAARALIAAPEGVAIEEPPRAKVFRFRVQQHPGSTAVGIRTPDGGKEFFQLPKVSDGMAQNAVLAVLTAWRLGCSSGGIAGRLATWKPARLRGEWLRCGDRDVFVDCYNANPAAMEDSARLFAETADPARPRLYLLGCMSELGERSGEMHRETGRKLPLRSGDRVLVIGAEAAPFRQGMLEGEGKPAAGDVTICDSIEEMAPVLEGFAGCVFLKGSRAYGLERLLERLPAAAPEGRKAAC